MSMDTNAARRARRKAVQQDLRKAVTDEEAVPAEWVDLHDATGDEAAHIKRDIAIETERFVNEPDIRKALARRDRAAKALHERIGATNTKIRRLNLIAPDARFTKGTLDAESLLRPLFRSTRRRPE